MEDFIKLTQFAVAFSVYYVWIFRFHNVIKEFKSFGLSDVTRNLVGASKITLSTLLILKFLFNCHVPRVHNRKILIENVKYRGKVDFFFISHHNIFLIINI